MMIIIALNLSYSLILELIIKFLYYHQFSMYKAFGIAREKCLILKVILVLHARVPLRLFYRFIRENDYRFQNMDK